MQNYIMEKVFYFHCIIKSDLNFFLRSERSNWRYTGNFRKYPSLLSYIRYKIKKNYGTSNIKEGLELYSKDAIYKKEFYDPYVPDEYLPYPSLIKKEMKKKNVYRLEL